MMALWVMDAQAPDAPGLATMALAKCTAMSFLFLPRKFALAL